jgi:uncharacterized protein (TIGR03118 family)
MQNIIEPLENRLLMSHSSFYVQTNLVSDNGVPGTRTDPNLVNAWGLAPNGNGPWWVAANGTSVSLAFDGTGAQAAANVSIPPPAGQTDSNPTGVVANSSSGFMISSGGNSAPASYVFVTETGTVSGWNFDVDPTHAIREVDNSPAGAVYKGAAIGRIRKSNFLYAADFHNNRIDVFDSAFHPVSFKHSPFTDTHLRAGYAPFNVANIGGNLFVSYAKQDADAHDDVGGPRHGFVDIFNTSGVLLKRFTSFGTLDSPWAMVQAPSNFGIFSDDILIGNFGNGLISAFNGRGRFVGFVTGGDGNPISIDGLWGLAFGNGATAGPTNSLFFAAGPAGESHGLFGSLTIGVSHRHLSATLGSTGGMNY